MGDPLSCMTRFPDVGMIWTDMQAIDAEGRELSGACLGTMHSAWDHFSLDGLFTTHVPVSTLGARFAEHRPPVFPPVQVAPEGSPTGFPLGGFAETLISADKALGTKGFALIRCSFCCLAISLHRGQRLSKLQKAADLQTRRPMGGGAATKRPRREVFLQH